MRNIFSPMTMIPVLILTGTIATHGQGHQPGNLRDFMRQKLKHSQAVLEGVAVEDYNQVRVNAMALKKLSEDAQWRVSMNPEYVKHSADFGVIADELARRARDEDLSGVTLSYVKLTMSCVECHQLLRDRHLLGPELQER